MSSEIVVKPKPKTNGMYFTQETENAIIEYNNTLDFDLRSKIYRERIHYAFFKLTENIIHTFKFYYTEVDNIEDLQHEVISFLLSKIHLFNPEKGAKAYSYFGTIAKRYLIISNTKNYKKRVDKAPIEELESDERHSYNIDDTPANQKLSMFMDKYIEYCSSNIYKLFPKNDDAKIADAILELFRKRESIEIFNKKALYIYIREIIDAKTPKITKIANKLYDVFKEHYYFYLENGYTNFP
jgi:DNA-directed RNA polymerase specialized sigma24 family protein